MSLTPENLKLRIILSFYKEMNVDQTVVGISRYLREDKQRISRTMIAMEKEGLLDRSNTRAPKLTAKGEELCQKCAERFQIAQNHLLYEGVDMETATQDAYILALGCSDELTDIIRKTDSTYRVKRELRDYTRFTGELLAKRIGDGSYQYPFIIYRDEVKDGNNISMANDGFAHPCTLHVKHGIGTIQLLIQPMTQPSKLDGKSVHGKVDRVQYFELGRFVNAEFNNDVVSLPASAIRFVNIKDGNKNILHGSVCLKMRCSCGLTHMPESTAMFTMLI